MLGRNTWTTLGLMGTLTLVGACDDSTGPDEEFTPEAALTDYQAMEAVINSDEWDDFRAASSLFSYGDGSSQDVPAALAQTIESLSSLRGSGGDTLARAVIRNLGDLPIHAQAIISETHRGVTFAWDVELGEYSASELTGAPANGVRFVLYELDENEDPIVENEIGFVDLVDEGDEVEGIVLRLSATANELHFLDYRVELENPEPGSGALSIDGFLRNDTDQLDFAIAVQGSQSGGSETVDITFDASIDSRDFEVSLALDGVNDETGEAGSLTLSVSHGAHSVEVSGTVTEGVVDGLIRLNGEDWATMTGAAANPTFNSADGDGFTAQELEMLGQIGNMAERVFAFFGELMEPAMHIILLGLIL